MSNYSSAKVSQLGSLIVGKPIDTGISARSAQEMLEYVATSYIMQNGANVGGQWHPTLLMATQFPAGAYQSPSLSGTLVLKAMITFRCVRYVPLGGVGAIAPAV